MAEITAALVKELRETTGVGMMDCKKALTETRGELEEAVDWLRKNGLAAAAKKSGRVAAEGLVAVRTDATRGAIVEVNAETDFLARNEAFQNFVRAAAGAALAVEGDLDRLGAANYPQTDHSVAEELTSLIAKVGENMRLRRADIVSIEEGAVAAYVHNQVGPELGTIAVLVALESSGNQEKLQSFGRRLAMHISWAAPRAIEVADFDPGILERERKVLTEQARASGRPDDIVAKMVEGRLKKFYAQVCLLEQTFVVDTEVKVGAAIERAAEDLGAAIKIAGFHRYQLGEGVERTQSDFAAEVAAQAGR